jgi:hypothetical protein
VRDNLHGLSGATVTVDLRKTSSPGYTLERKEGSHDPQASVTKAEADHP